MQDGKKTGLAHGKDNRPRVKRGALKETRTLSHAVKEKANKMETEEKRRRQ